MVNDVETFGIDPAAGHPERALALGYAPAAAQRPISAVFALDATLARLALATRDPMVAQLRLTWWYEALVALGTGQPPPQPILQALAKWQVEGASLARIEEGWERLLHPPEEIDLNAFAAERGELFSIAARLAGADDDCAAAGQGWALADLAKVTADGALARRAASLAGPLLERAAARPWSRRGRFVGALVHVARADLTERQPIGAPARVARLAWHRLTGR